MVCLAYRSNKLSLTIVQKRRNSEDKYYIILQAPIMIISIVIFVLWCTGSIAVLTLYLPTDWTIIVLVILLVSAIILGRSSPVSYVV